MAVALDVHGRGRRRHEAGKNDPFDQIADAPSLGRGPCLRLHGHVVIDSDADCSPLQDVVNSQKCRDGWVALGI